MPTAYAIITLRVAYNPAEEGRPDTWDWTTLTDSTEPVVVINADFIED